MIDTRRVGTIAGLSCLAALVGWSTLGPAAQVRTTSPPAGSDIVAAGSPALNPARVVQVAGVSGTAHHVQAGAQGGGSVDTASRPEPTTHQVSTPTLAGTNIITASSSGYVQVRVPQDTTIGGTANHFQVSGLGRFVGAVLRPSDATATDGRAIVEGSVNHCWSPGCTPSNPQAEFFVLGDFAPADDGQTNVLPAGDYDLYVITDGSPVEVTMTLNTLPGVTALTPAVSVSPHFEQPSPAGKIGIGGGAVWAGSANPVTDPGLVILAASADGSDPLVADSVGLCLYSTGPPTANVYQPGCYGSDTGANIVSIPQVDSDPLREAPTGMFVVRGENWNLGGYFDGVAASVDAFHFVSIGLDLNRGRP